MTERNETNNPDSAQPDLFSQHLGVLREATVSTTWERFGSAWKLIQWRRILGTALSAAERTSKGGFFGSFGINALEAVMLPQIVVNYAMAEELSTCLIIH